ncbi:uncharacterized protein M6B38_279110 [Iris pallida]|uniref:Uncharacterized protein n=1 Tax=Iris pallida TaxID=29817 RepID=A0AAX6EXG1_IRIPA|nr:uncharacterized protein M6B38_165675 [Iris pallida]KAJ6846191.1 uncharacterized protein M6B38_279110 [Iris pallida]
MSSGEVRKVSRQDIQLVQNLIERCLQLYMDQKEVVETLLYQAKIEPGFTELVWQKLEEENRDFFKAYHVRLMLKNQIIIFNKLLEKQVELMRKVGSSGVASVPASNGSSSSAMHKNQSCYLSEQASSSSRPDSLLGNGGSSSAIMNGGPSGNESIHLGNGSSVISGRMDVSPSLLSTQSSQVERSNGMNGTTIKSEPSYSNNSEFTFCTDGSYVETRLPIGDAPGASFSSSEMTGQPLNEPLLDIDSSSFGFLSQIPRNFSFSDLTDDFTQSADILENYGRSPFLAPETNNFSDSPGGDCKGDDRRLDTISEGFSYDDFVSD